MRYYTLLFALLFSCFAQSHLLATTVNYTADNTTNFLNPERGFYTMYEWHATNTTTTNLTKSVLTTIKSQGESLVMRLYYFENYCDSDLPANVLKAIAKDAQLLRDNGCKMILRFAYTNSNASEPYQDASPSIWKRHLEQLTPVLKDNVDVIAVVQAGFLGVWGEWYYSSEGTGEEIQQKVKTNLIDQLLAAVPASRAVQLRTPLYKTQYIGNTKPLTATEAFTGTPKARLGHHNDAFLSGESNMGTYTNRTQDMAYIAADCLYLPNGGETCDTENNYLSYTTAAKAKEEMALLHYSYLHSGYAREVLDRWSESDYNEIARKLGYRYVLVSGTYPSSAVAGETMSLLLDVKNDGYAALYNERKAYLVLNNASHTYSLPLSSDPRLWTPGQTTTVNETITLPESIEQGTYNLYLHLPDIASTLASNPSFAVRCANKDVWDASTGWNNLKAQITINKGSAPDTKPTDEDIDISGGTNVSYTNCSSISTYDAIKKEATIYYDCPDSWLWAGVEYPLDNVTDILSFSFDYKGDGKDVALLSYLNDGTYLWITSGDIPSMSSTEWQSITITSFAPLWTTATYDFGTKPMISVGFRANPATAEKGSFSIRNVKLVLDKPASTHLSSEYVNKEKTYKYIHNGRLFIRLGEKDYSIMGQGL